ncbi:MAG: DUF805 domain-containing protein [Hymenobacter sp.]|nr:MAG: DUF805 domain-containing protein [Hymenobacter sp.]
MRYYLTVLRKYASVEGRAGRAEYWNFVFCNYLISLALAFVEAQLHTHFIVLLYTLAVFLPALAVGMRRMHDVGKYGWYYLWLPGYNIIMACIPGTRGPNEYGPAPVQS